MDERPYGAVAWAEAMISNVVSNDGEFSFPAASFALAALLQAPGFEVVKDENGEPSHVNISSELAQLLVERGAENQDQFDVIVDICAINLRRDKQLPEALRDFICGILLGDIQRPKVRHRAVRRDWYEKFFKLHLIFWVAKRFSLAPTKNEASFGTVCACEIVAEAFENVGMEVSYSSLVRLVSHPDNLRFRQENSKLMEWMEARS
ncbi:hypothetical protein [Sulfitobacter mediterraneus]|uniref:hypothetical protein n=1 Tax=Sulfitobacter mediterraneus TaxID=83219 RepID=UPI0021A65F6D|nr:hypothetical protein [Sulfitobacter mediterraneus]UWR10945.1 hypothetical protein K3753_17100 [Sulfitobacter mediterraneus]